MAEGWQDFVGAGVARQDEYGEHYYTPLFEDPDKYMYNMILGVGSPFIYSIWFIKGKGSFLQPPSG